MFIKTHLYLGLIASLLLTSCSANAEDVPAWEAGAGLVTFVSPHYLGSDQYSSYVLPLPYMIYRGDYVRADRDGIRGFIYDSEKLDLRLSGGGSLPVNSKDSDARDGMDDLDLVLEGGPTLQYQLFSGEDQVLRLDLPIRAAFSIGSSIAHQGWTTNPRLLYKKYFPHWTITSTLGPVFSDSSYHGYIYDVDRRFATPDRASYNAKSGYTGTRASLSFRRRFGRLFFGTFFSYYNLNGAANEDSPLVNSTDYFSTGLSIAWVFAEADKRVAN